MDYSAGASERKLEPEFNGARRAEREHARTNPNSNNGSVRAGCAIERTRAARQNAAQDVSWNVEVREVEQVVEADAGLDGNGAIFDRDFPGPGEARIERLEPSEADFTRHNRLQSGCDPSQRLQLGKRKQAVVDEDISGRGWIVGNRVVVIVYEIRQPSHGHAAHECPRFGARDWIAHRSVAGEIGAENFSGSISGGRNGKSAGERAIEVEDRSNAEMKRQIGIAPE